MADKKKKIKVTHTMGCIPYNIDQFNKRNGTNDNNNPTPKMIKTDAEFVAAANDNNYGWIFSSNTGEATANMSADSGSNASAGEGGGLAEEKMHVSKNGYGMSIEIPGDITLIPTATVANFIKRLKPQEEFKVGYITVLFSTEGKVRNVEDYITVLKCTKFTGCTGIDYRDAEVVDDEIVQNQGISDRAKFQQDNPDGQTDYGYDKYGNKYNTNNDRVKSGKDIYRREYGEINKTVIQKTAKVLNPETNQEVSTRLDTILFYQTPNSTPESIYYVCFEANSSNYLKIKDLNELSELVKKQYPANSKLADRIEKLIKKQYTIAHAMRTSVSTNEVTDSDESTDSTVKPAVRALYTNQIYYLSTGTQEIGDDLSEALLLTEETKRYVKRYYIRPQNIVCSNKEEILKALIEIGDENCSVYSLKSLSDHDDVHLLTNKDIIYYYDNGILYDKNHVKVMDYELGPKHEEERKKFNQEGDNISTKDLATEYDDRLTMVDVQNDDTIKVGGSKVENLELQEAQGSKDIKYYEKMFEKEDRDSIIADAKFIVKQLHKAVTIEGLSGEELLNKKKQLIDNQIDSYKNIANDDIRRYGAQYLKAVVEKIIANAPTVGVAILKAAGAKRVINGGRRNQANKAAAQAIAKDNKTTLKDWFQEHTTNIRFSFPAYTGESTIGGPGRWSDADINKFSANWEGEFNGFIQVVKNATEGGDYVFRNTDTEADTNYPFWHRSGKITFDTTIENAPQSVQDFIKALKYNSSTETDKKPWDEMLKSNVVDSFAVCWGVLELFNFDCSFYKIKNNAPAFTDQDDDNTFDQTFESYNAYGQKLVEGKAVGEICCICGREIDGYGNNPEPYKSAENGERCCDPCNMKFVIPARLAAMNLEKTKGKEGKEE